MNSKRYFSSLIEIIDAAEIRELLKIEPPLNIFSKKSYFSTVKNLSIKQGSRKGFPLHIYKNGEEIPGSPFNSYRKGGKAIGLVSVSSITNYIDTGKVFKDVYTFYSSPRPQ